MTTIEAQAVLFDLDGTLVNSNATVENHWREFADWYGLDGDELVKHSHGVGHVIYIRQHLPAANEHDLAKAVQRFEELEVSDVGDEVPMPGALALLDQLRPGTFTIVTACWWELAEARARAAGIALPEHTVTANQLQQGKPSPEGYLLGAQRLGVEPQKCLVFEDSLSGVQAAMNAHCQLVALLTTTPRAKLETVLAPESAIVQDLASVSLLTTAPQLVFEID